MNLKKLQNHVKLCKRNLKSKRVICCAECAFEDDITTHFPDMKKLFIKKRKYIRETIKKVKGIKNAKRTHSIR